MFKAYYNTNSPPNSLPSTNQLCPAKATQGIVDFDFPLAVRSVSFFALRSNTKEDLITVRNT
jgi:hypothetical protein